MGHNLEELGELFDSLDRAPNKAQAYAALTSGPIGAAMRDIGDDALRWLASRAKVNHRSAWALPHFIWDRVRLVDMLGIELLAETYVRYGPPPGRDWWDGWADGVLRDVLHAQPPSWCIDAVNRILRQTTDQEMIRWVGADLVEELLRHRPQETEKLLQAAAEDRHDLAVALSVARNLVGDGEPPLD